jgi:hypothetical protein
VKEQDFTNYDLCKECKGECCKRMGCGLSPEFLNSCKDKAEVEMKIRELLNKGIYSIDWWEGDTQIPKKLKRVPYIRARNKNAGIIDASWGGECMLLTEKGCSLSFEDRPREGQRLIPNASFNCTGDYGKKDVARDWRKYADILEKIIMEDLK